MTVLLYGVVEADAGLRLGNWFFDRWLRRVVAARAPEARPV